ncbi:hypothetical protein pb186bvf_019667 [Paramecium bursaria]
MKAQFVRNSSRNRQIHEVYQYTKTDKLGQGSYGIVYKAIHKETGIPRAIKVIHKPSIKQKERIENELRTMEVLDHPHVIRVFETYEDEENIYIVLEICSGGDIFDKVLELGNFNQNDALTIFIQIIRSINYYQNLKIVHRDLKPENFLFQSKEDFNSLYIIDFGLAKNYIEGLQQQWTKAGTAYYVAPEVLSGCYDNRCDIWSAGVILYVLLCGYPPFYGETEQEILYQIKKGKFEFDGVEWQDVHQCVKDLITNMIIECQSRFSPRQILENQWLKSYQQEGLPLLTHDKIQRWQSYSELKKVSLLYLATQIDQYIIQDIKNAFLFMNKSQTGILSSQEISYFIGKEMLYSLEYFQFIAICVEPGLFKSERYLKLMFYFLSDNGIITKQSLNAVNIDLDYNLDYQQYILII